MIVRMDGTDHARVDFCGEEHHLPPDGVFVVGREGDLGLDDNKYLHRRFLVISRRSGLWWVDNVGSRISATVSDPDGRMQAWLAPGAGLPLVFARTLVLFTAGPTTYEFEVLIDEPPFAPTAEPIPRGGTRGADVTIGDVTFTPEQLLLIIALAEPALRREGWGTTALPATSEAARRLGWTTVKFNRKLDNVCEKLTKIGVKGLHGGQDRLATERRARLVEYALAARWVTSADLALLERVADAG
jgi:hypothetical protein